MTREVRERRTAQRGDAALVRQPHLRQTAGATLEIRESEVRLERGRLERDCGRGVGNRTTITMAITMAIVRMIRRRSDGDQMAIRRRSEGIQMAIRRRSDGDQTAIRRLACGIEQPARGGEVGIGLVLLERGMSEEYLDATLEEDARRAREDRARLGKHLLRE